ncbi:MAG: hypothetical protein AAGG56_00770 [Pseudomonadota bacterium]
MEADAQIVAEGNPILGTIMFLLFAAIAVIPFWKLWSRTGHSGFWGLLAVIPLANLIALWVLAFKKWPTDDKA